MSAFYPSFVAHLRLRFDESLVLGEVPAPVSTDDQARQRPSPTTQPASEPLILRRADRNMSHVDNRVPRSADVELPGYRKAGTFHLTFDFKELPIDPRMVRACGVEIHLGAIPADDFARGMKGETDANGRRLSILRTVNADHTQRHETLVMVGVVDEWDVTHGTDGSTIEMRGRDMRAILLDSPLSPCDYSVVDLSQPLDSVIRDLLFLHPFGEQFQVLTVPEEWEGGRIPSPSDAAAIPMPRRRAGARGRRAGARMGTPAGSNGNLSFWDMIVQICGLVGAVPYFAGSVLRVRPSRSLFDQARAGISDFDPAPFAGGRPREIPGESPLRIRRLVYGRDIQELKVNRKLGGMKPKVVEVISLDTSSTARGAQRVLSATWPDVGPARPGTGCPPLPRATPQNPATTRARRTNVAPGGAQAQEDRLRIYKSGITDVAQLRRIAQDTFEEIGRGEMGGTVKTKNLASFGGDNTDPDLLRIRPGDAIEFMVDTRNLSSRAPLVTTLTEHFRSSFHDEVRAINARLRDENLSRVIVACARGSVRELVRFFRVANVKYGWSSTDGIEVTFDFQNYILTGVTPSVGSQPGTVQRAVAGAP